MKTAFERAMKRHGEAVGHLHKLADRRDKSMRVFIRDVAKHDAAVKAVTRTQRNLDKARIADREAKAARKLAKATQQPIAI
jgi:hypothetical protein